MNVKVSATAYDDDDDNAEKISSARTVASIDDLLIQIFLSIPTLKPLVRLKLVCKHWNFIISDQNFNLLLNQKNPNPTVGLIFSAIHKFYCSYVVSFDKPTNGPLFRAIKFNSRYKVAALNSCNGLLLCKSIGDPNERWYVCNPTTNKYFMLPKIDNRFGTRKLYRFYSMSLAFDPSKSPHYKVVCATVVSHHMVRLDVYSSETGCWIKHGESFAAGVDFTRGVYWNGAIHWISSNNTGQSLYFNPDNDQVPQVMLMPPMIGTNWSYIYHYFGESYGHLHYIEDDKTVMELNVYEMRTDYSEWFVKYRVDCSLIDNRLDSITCALIRGMKEEDSFLVWGSDKKIIRYNLVNKTCETILEKLDEDGARIYPTWKHPLQYIESLSYV